MDAVTRIYLYGLVSEVQEAFRSQILGTSFEPVCCTPGETLPEPDPILILGKESWNPEQVEALRRGNPACQVLLTLTEKDLDSFLPSATTRIDDYLILPLNAKRLLFALEKAVDRKVQVERLLHTTRELDQTTEELSYFINVGKALTSTLDTGSILNIIMEKTSELVKAEAGSVLLLDEETHELYFELTEGEKKNDLKRFRLKVGEGIAGWVAQHGEPIIVEDVATDPRFCNRIDDSLHFRTRSILCIPLKSKGKILGVLEVINRIDGKSFGQKDLDLVLTLVDQASIAIENSLLYRKATELAITDGVTQLYNFRYLHQALDVEISRSNRYRTEVSLIFLDLDYFKKVNDRFGHLVGSQALVEVGDILRRSLRPMDVICRYGGDEFIVVLPETGPQSAFGTAERLRTTVESYTFHADTGEAFHLTASFGIAAYPNHVKDKNELIQLADQSMYRAKDATRNAVFMIGKEGSSLSREFPEG
ncbi:MAG: sensor domain-containing diguanylate cyclase [Deltaproteobacteria bacterium]|nr:sensor domain-containing diguanylate cyclase [Deltaproteobacteria bacterium]